MKEEVYFWVNFGIKTALFSVALYVDIGSEKLNEIQ